MAAEPEVKSAGANIQASTISTIVLGFAADPMARWVWPDSLGIKPAKQDAGDIGKAIPADRDRPDLNDHGVEGGKGDVQMRHGRARDCTPSAAG